jgi:hypothetical protein
MSYNAINSVLLQDALRAITTVSGSRREVKRVLKSLREALLLFGSQSEDNCFAVRHLDIRKHEDRAASRSALSVLPSGISLSSIVYEVESMPLPKRVEKRLPTLSQSEWSAAMRIVVLILKAFEQQEESDGEETVNGGEERGVKEGTF